LATMTEIRVPDIGQFKGVEIIEMAVKVGDKIKKEDTLITLETEKASMEVPSPVNGVLQDLKVKLGDKVSQGDLIAIVAVEESAELKTPETVSEKAPEKAPEKAAEKIPEKTPEKAPEKLPE